MPMRMWHVTQQDRQCFKKTFTLIPKSKKYQYHPHRLDRRRPNPLRLYPHCPAHNWILYENQWDFLNGLRTPMSEGRWSRPCFFGLIPTFASAFFRLSRQSANRLFSGVFWNAVAKRTGRCPCKHKKQESPVNSILWSTQNYLILYIFLKISLRLFPPMLRSERIICDTLKLVICKINLTNFIFISLYPNTFLCCDTYFQSRYQP